MINLEKNLFYLHEKTSAGVCNLVNRITSINKRTFPFIYLRCPVFYRRKKRSHFEKLCKKVMERLSLWQHKLLSFGGRYILIANVLQSMLIYLLSAMNPPVSVTNQLHKIFDMLFQENTIGPKIRIGFLGITYAIPKRRGICFKSLQTVTKDLCAKLWSNFRTSNSSLQSDFIWNKYCKKFHPIIAKRCGTSHVQRKLIAAREKVEHNI